MLAVWSGRHAGHDPQHEVQFGERIPIYEVPARAEAIRAALEADGGFSLVGPRDHGTGPIEAVHDPAMLRYLEEAWRDWEALGRGGELVPHTVLHPGLREGMGPAAEPSTPAGRIGFWCFETMTPIVAGTYEAVRAAADVGLTAADAVLGGERAAYALCRPPGHHAARAVFGGYCFLNNAAIAAEHLVRETGEPVAVLDVDYHHGNGTQQIFWERGDVLYVSLHGDTRRAYPYFTGSPEETGAGRGRGATMNVPLPEGCSDDRYLDLLDRALEAVAGFPGETLVVSLGLDTLAEDPITDLALTLDVYPEIGRRVGALGRRTVVVQEGGYHLPSLGEGVVGFLRGVGGG